MIESHVIQEWEALRTMAYNEGFTIDPEDNFILTPRENGHHRGFNTMAEVRAYLQGLREA